MVEDKQTKELKIEEKPSEVLRPAPDVEADFTALLQDYGVAEKAAAVVTKHIADTGSDRVFEKPRELLEKLAKFPRQIPPVTRRNVLDHWIAQNKIPIPEGYVEEAELPAEELRQRRVKTEKEPEKYSVDTVTGAIRAAMTTDKMALTWDEAEKLSNTIKKELADKAKKGEKKVAYVYDAEAGVVRMAKEGEVGGTFEQAKELKKMAEENGKGKEKPVTYVYDTADKVVRMAKEGEVGGTFEQAKELKKMAEENGKGREKPVTYVYDTVDGVVRMAKEGEVGGTMEQAKELKKMAEETGKGGEKPVTYVYDSADRVVRMAKEGEVGGTFEQAKELKKMAEENGKGREKPVTYAYDAVDGVVRMAKESEVGGTMEQAKELKKMAEEGGKGAEESPFIPDKDGNWTLNPKARVTGIELMALDAIRKAQERGEPVEPLEALAQAAERMKIFREALGGGGAELPEWMRDPLKFQKTIQELSPKGDTEALKELRDEMTKLREDHHQAELKRRDEQNASLVTVIQEYRGEVTKLRDEIEKNRMATGRSAYDLLGDLVQKVPNREDIRAMVMEAVGKGPKLLPRGSAEREGVLEGMATNIEQAAEVKSFVDNWWRLG